MADLVAAVHSVDADGNGRAKEVADNDRNVGAKASTRKGDTSPHSWAALTTLYTELGFPTA